MADTENTAANGFDWTSILGKGIDIAGGIIGLKYGQQTTPTVQPTTLNPANPGTTGQPSPNAPAAQTAGLPATTIAIIGGAAVLVIGGMFLLAGRRR